jgi:hypothetical protein
MNTIIVFNYLFHHQKILVQGVLLFQMYEVVYLIDSSLLGGWGDLFILLYYCILFHCILKPWLAMAKEFRSLHCDTAES